MLIAAITQGTSCRQTAAPFGVSTLVFIDETGASTKMAQLHGRAPRGERLRAAIPHGHSKTTTPSTLLRTCFVGALRLTGMTAPMVLDGPMTGEWFLAYTQQVLAPSLRPATLLRQLLRRSRL